MVQSVRGMRDVLPEEARLLKTVEHTLLEMLQAFAYEEVQLPLLEFTELFSRGVGEATDIVEKEMYTMLDRDGESITLRPEGTAGCVRALQQHGLLYNQTQRVYYRGPMFRYERPQRGRYRQFYQLGAEAFGLPGPDIDAELMLLGTQCWRALGIAEHVQLELNSLGSAASRRAYREALVAYLTPLADQLDEDSRRRLTSNPLRILDSKAESTRALLAEAPELDEYLDEESREHFAALRELLEALDVPYVCNPRLVRGLDYYTHSVFEWTTQALGAQGTICAGGRYDGLVELLGGKPTPGAGFALGVERVALLCEQVQAATPEAGAADVYCCVLALEQLPWAHEVAQTLRGSQALRARGRPWRIRVHAGGGKLKNQLRRADQCGAAFALIIGEDEAAERRVTVKTLRGEGGQETLDVDALTRFLADRAPG